MSDENLEVLSIEAANYSSGMFLEQYHLLNQICGKSRFISTFIGIFHIDKYIFNVYNIMIKIQFIICYKTLNMKHIGLFLGCR